VKHFFEYAGFRLMLASLAWTPLPLALGLSRFYFRLLDTAVPKLRKAGIRNLELAGFKERDKVVDGVFQSLARLMVLFARLPRISKKNVGRYIRYEGLRNFQEAKRRGKGVLIATGHFGNWELSAHAHALLTEPMHVVVRPLDNPRIDSLVERYRASAANRVITKKDAARGILRALKDNEAVGILIDQNSLPDEGIFVDFFGTLACTNSVFAKLAAHSGAAVILGYAVWSDEEQRYILHFSPPLDLSGNAATDTQHIQSALEDAIRQYPDQWLWLHRRWKTRPQGEPSLYD